MATAPKLNPQQAAARRAKVAQLRLTAVQAEAQASYYSLVDQQLALQRRQLGGDPSRLSTPWPLVITGEQGNYSWQDTQELARERDRSRQLEQTNWLASSAMDRTIERVIGTKIVVVPRTKDEAFNAAVRDWLRNYWYTRACDVRGQFTFSRLIHLLFRAKMRDGDCGLLLTEDAAGNPKLQVIEAQRITSPGLGADLDAIRARGNQVVDGVEMDANGGHVAYWVVTQQVGQPQAWQRVDARDFIFQFRTSRYTHVRGEPAFRGGYWLFDQIMGYFEAVTVAARIGASAAMVAKRKNPGTAAMPNAVGGRRSTGGDGAVGVAPLHAQVPIVPGMINVIGVDEELVAFNPAQPTQSFPDAIRTFCRFVGIRFGLTIEDLLLDFEHTSYSSSKAARAAARAAADVEQEDFSLNVITRVYQWAVSKAVKNGAITVPPPESFWDHEWLPPVWPSVEPLKDAQAAEKLIALGVECRDNVAAASGYSFPELCVQNGKDRELMVASGLNPDIAVGNSGLTEPETGKGDQPVDGPPPPTPPGVPRQPNAVRGRKPPGPPAQR